MATGTIDNAERERPAPAVCAPVRRGAAWRVALPDALALLLAASHGLASRWAARPGEGLLLGLPAPELQGALALALALLAAAGLACVAAGSLGGAGRAAALARWLRWAATASLPLAALQLLMPLAGPPLLGPWSARVLLLALAMLGLLQWWPRRPRADGAVVVAMLALALLWALCAGLLCLLIPARLLLDGLPLAGGLSWPGTAVLALLALAATLRLRRHPARQAFLTDREDRRIFGAHLAMLCGATTLATLLFAGLLAVRSVQELSAPLQRGVQAQARALDRLLERLGDASARAAPLLPPSGGDDAVPVLAALHEQIEVLGQVSVAIESTGRSPQGIGRLHAGPWLTLPARGPQQRAIGQGDGLLMQVLQPLPQRPGEWLRVQLRPLQPEAQQLPADGGAGPGTLLLCVPEQAQAACLAADGTATLRMPLAPRPDGSPWPIQRAWRGEAGVTRVRDPWGQAAVIAYAPVGRSGLGLAHKLPLAPLLQRLVDTAVPALLAALAVMAAGAWLQYRRSFPRLRALHHAKALLELVLASLPVGVWIADRRGRIVGTNPAVTQLWGGAPELHEGRPVGRRARRLADGRAIGPDDYPMLQAVRSGQATINELLEVERSDGTRRTLMSSALPLIDAEGAIQGAISVDEDLTTLRRAQAAIVAAQQLFESLFDSTAVGMAVWDAQGRFERVNQALCELLGRDEAALRGLALSALGEPDAAAEDLAALGRMQRGELAKRAVERRWRRADGRWVWVLLVVSLLRLPEAEQPQFVVQVLDIDRQRRAQQALEASQARLRALSANEEALIEEERKHIAREVHDELGQALTALKMSLAMLRRGFGRDAALERELARMAAMVDGTLDVVRHVASNLRPAALDYGLVAAIEWLAEDFSHRWELPCQLRLDGGEIALGDAQATAVFRIVQESLTNIARHAQARHVEIRLGCADATLQLSVRDDGIGFDPAQERGGRFGLLGMRERALKIGAELHIDSRPGAGTTIHLRLPLAA